jgi:hypothetical protein
VEDETVLIIRQPVLECGIIPYRAPVTVERENATVESGRVEQ